MVGVAVQRHGDVIIVVDAIDEVTESSEQQLLLDRLTILAQQSPSVKLLVTS